MELKTKAKIYCCNPNQVKVREGLDRYRKDMGKLEELAESIRKNGQYYPIILTKEMELVDGGRRTAACMMLSSDINFVFKEDIGNDEVDDFTLRAMEAESNLRRKSFTPAEEQLAIADLHRLYVAKYGAVVSGRPTESEKKENGKITWSPAKTAELLGISRPQVSRALSNADAIQKNPELLKAKSKQQISNMAKRAEAVEKAKAEAAKRKQEVEKAKSFYVLHQESCVDVIEESSVLFDIVIADSPYGIEINKLQKTAQYKDRRDAGIAFAAQLAKPLFEKTTSSAHLYWFCAPEYFWRVKKIFELANWQVYVKPLIWIKRSDGSCNNPDKWPASCYEMILYARKEGTQLAKCLPDWIQCDPISIQKKTHHSEKPVALIENLLLRSVYPGMRLFDPFCGSGAIVEAGLNKKLLVDSCEIDPDTIAVAESRIARAVEREAKK